MSLIFNYSRIKDTVSRANLPGQKGKVTPLDTITAFVTGSTGKYENGMAVKIVADSNGIRRATPIAPGDTADKVAGFIIQDLRGETVVSQPFGSPRFIYEYAQGVEVSVLSKGVIWVPVQDSGDITAGSAVYIRTAVDSSNNVKPVGGIESATATGNVKLTGAYFTGRVGYPLANQNNGSTTQAGLTGKTAEIVVELPLLA